MRVILAEDSVLLREGLVRLLVEEGFEVVAQAGDAEALLPLVAEHQPDVVVVDIRMPPSHTDEGIRAAHDIRRAHPKIAVLVLSQYAESDYAMRLLGEGGTSLGYLMKDHVLDVGTFTTALRRVAAGECVVDPEIVARLVDRRRVRDPLDDLTPRERDVLGLMAEGRSNAAIADALFLSDKTVETHVRSIFMKLSLEADADSNRRVLAVLKLLRK